MAHSREGSATPYDRVNRVTHLLLQACVLHELIEQRLREAVRAVLPDADTAACSCARVPIRSSGTTRATR